MYFVGHGSGCVLLWVCVPIAFTKNKRRINDRRFLMFEKGWVNVYLEILDRFLRSLKKGGVRVVGVGWDFLSF